MATNREAAEVRDPSVNGPEQSQSFPKSIEQQQFEKVEYVISRHFAVLLKPLKAALAVCISLSFKGRTKPLSLIFETPSGYGKSTTIQFLFPIPGEKLDQFVYRSDKFTPKSFVSHAANIPKAGLSKIDLLPRLKNHVLLTKELAPLFRGRNEEVIDNFTILIPVLDGKGFTSDSGVHGQRGYCENIIFNWIGATTPLPTETHRIMYQLGTRLLFYETPSTEPTEEELLAYAEREDHCESEELCQKAVNDFLIAFYESHPIGSVPPDSIVIPSTMLMRLTRWAKFLTYARAAIRTEEDNRTKWPVAGEAPEGPFKVVNYFKEIARSHALLHGRSEVNEDDLELIAHIAISSIPGHLRPIVRRLRKVESVGSAMCQALCRVTAPTARLYLQELALLRIVELTKGEPSKNSSDTATLRREFAWLHQYTP